MEDTPRPTLSGFRDFCDTRPDDYQVPEREPVSRELQAYERLWQTEKDIQILRSKDSAYNSRDPEVVYKRFDHLTKDLDSSSREKFHRFIGARAAKWHDDLSRLTSTHLASTQKRIERSAHLRADKSLTADETAFQAREAVMNFQEKELRELHGSFENDVYRKIYELHALQKERSTQAPDLNAVLKARAKLKARETDRNRDGGRGR